VTHCKGTRLLLVADYSIDYSKVSVQVCKYTVYLQLHRQSVHYSGWQLSQTDITSELQIQSQDLVTEKASRDWIRYPQCFGNQQPTMCDHLESMNNVLCVLSNNIIRGGIRYSVNQSHDDEFVGEFHPP
jgi:hypothetical protein